MATSEQLKLAKALGITVSSDTGRVAAAKIMDSIGEAVMEGAAIASTERQRKFGLVLELELSKVSLRVASAKIQDELDSRNEEAVKRLKLEPDMPIMIERVSEEDGKEARWFEPAVVSSVKNGLVYLRGGNGRCAAARRVRRPTRKELKALAAGEGGQSGRRAG